MNASVMQCVTAKYWLKTVALCQRITVVLYHATTNISLQRFICSFLTNFVYLYLVFTISALLNSPCTLPVEHDVTYSDYTATMY